MPGLPSTSLLLKHISSAGTLVLSPLGTRQCIWHPRLLPCVQHTVCLLTPRTTTSSRHVMLAFPEPSSERVVGEGARVPPTCWCHCSPMSAFFVLPLIFLPFQPWSFFSHWRVWSSYSQFGAFTLNFLSAGSVFYLCLISVSTQMSFPPLPWLALCFFIAINTPKIIYLLV